MPASSGVRSRLRRLHGRQAAATFSHTCWPPRLRGSTWSIESACPPQYWHWWASRAKTARRDSVVRRWYGTFTMYRSRMTSGVRSSRWAERTSAVVVVEHLGLLGQHQAHGPAGGHDAERLVRRIEDERTPHGP